jgi:hypothetical protein
MGPAGGWPYLVPPERQSPPVGVGAVRVAQLRATRTHETTERQLVRGRISTIVMAGTLILGTAGFVAMCVLLLAIASTPRGAR